jgi:hypothetical protein
VSRLHAVQAEDRARKSAFERARAAGAPHHPDCATFRIVAQSREGAAIKLICARHPAATPMREGAAADDDDDGANEGSVLLVLPHASAGGLRLEAGRTLRCHPPWDEMALGASAGACAAGGGGFGGGCGGGAPPRTAIFVSWNVTQDE